MMNYTFQRHQQLERRTGFRRFPYRIRQGEDILPAILCSPVLTEGRVKNLAPAKHNLLTCRIH